MNKVIGIPKALYYYYYIDIWKAVFDKLNIKYVISPNTNKEILKKGSLLGTTEMCISMKVFLGHVDYLKDKCDYILIPRINNYGIKNQTCTNFLSVYDVCKNLFDSNIINYNIEHTKNETELKGLIKIGKLYGYDKKKIKQVYKEAKEEVYNARLNFINENIKNLNSDNIKILLVGHQYNLYDYTIGIPIINYLEKSNIEIIYSDMFDSEITSDLSKKLSSTLYWKYSKEIIGSIPLVSNKIDGIIFVSAFPCGSDSLVNTLAIKNIEVPCINLVIDDSDSFTGIETRLESFIDVLESRRKDG